MHLMTLGSIHYFFDPAFFFPKNVGWIEKNVGPNQGLSSALFSISLYMFFQPTVLTLNGWADPPSSPIGALQKIIKQPFHQKSG